VSGVDRLELGPVDGDDLSSEEAELAAEGDELPADTANGLRVVLAEVGDGLAEGPGQGSQAPGGAGATSAPRPGWLLFPGGGWSGPFVQLDWMRLRAP